VEVSVDQHIRIRPVRRLAKATFPLLSRGARTDPRTPISDPELAEESLLPLTNDRRGVPVSRRSTAGDLGAPHLRTGQAFTATTLPSSSV